MHTEMTSDVMFFSFEQQFLPFLAPQVLGFEVDSINSVQFSNHTGWLSAVGSHCPASISMVVFHVWMSDMSSQLSMTSGNTQKPRKNSQSCTELRPLPHLTCNDYWGDWVVNALYKSSACSSWTLTSLLGNQRVTRDSQETELQNLRSYLGCTLIFGCQRENLNSI